MNKLSRWLGVACLVAGAGVWAAEQTLAVADVERIFKEHQRLKVVLAQFNEQSAAAAAERKAVMAELEGLQSELRQLNLNAQNVTSSEVERAQAGAQAESKLRELRLLEARLMRGDEASRRLQTTRVQEMRQQYFAEIQAQIRAYAGEHNLALVFDSSSLAAQGGVGGVLHAQPQCDITAAIIARINAAPAPAATNTPVRKAEAR